MSKKKIALICFDEAVAEMLKYILQEENREVVSVDLHEIASGNLNLQKIIKETDPLLVFFDISIFSPKNWERAKGEIRTALEGKKVVYLSSLSERQESMLEPTDEIISIPFNIEQVIEIAKKNGIRINREREI